ncbi:MAG TPA: hypothetical protein DCS60_00145, partial [Opitutae bacterium]|nr:hypothetical protein [Opitutae bacterium]
LRTFHFVPSWVGLDRGMDRHRVFDVEMRPQGYFDSLLLVRRDRLIDIKERLERAVPWGQRTVCYKTPTFERGNYWACLDNQRHLISI